MITETEAKQYYDWFMNKCSVPVDEMEWLLTNLNSNAKNYIKEMLEEQNEN